MEAGAYTTENTNVEFSFTILVAKFSAWHFQPLQFYFFMPLEIHSGKIVRLHTHTNTHTCTHAHTYVMWDMGVIGDINVLFHIITTATNFRASYLFWSRKGELGGS